jgi:hypothetical protein
LYGKILFIGGQKMKIADKEFLAEIDAKAEALKQKIINSKTDVIYTGTAYYVSPNGNDMNDGLSPETAWATLDRAFETYWPTTRNLLKYGDTVLLERGGTWYVSPDEHAGLTSDAYNIVNGVTLGAYGEGERPVIRGDIPEADELCASIVDHLFTYLKTKNTFRGGVYTGGCSPFNRAANNGRGTGALPNGRRSGEANFADSIAAVPGCDRKGPTAALKSMMHYRQTEACSGFVTQLKFDRSLFCTEKGLHTFVQLAKTYFDGGGQQISVNVLDRETLLAAQKDPDAYPNLVVRVGGYSDYFRNISPELRQNVIDRSSFEL